MPRNSKTNKRRTYRRRSYNRRLSDKRTNTLVERRIKEIAQAEDNKNIQYFLNPVLIAKQGITWDSLNSDPPLDDRLTVGNSNGPVSFCLSEIGNSLRNQQGNPGGSTARNSNTYLIKNIQANLRLQNRGTETKYVWIALVSVPNNTNSSGVLTEPTLDYYATTGIKYKGIFKKLQQTTEVVEETGAATTYVVDRQHTMLAQRSFALPPPRGLSGANNSSTGYSTKQISISKNYKRGKKVTYQFPNGTGATTDLYPLPDENIFLWIQTSGEAGTADEVVVWGMAGIRYRLLQPSGRGLNVGASTVGVVP